VFTRLLEFVGYLGILLMPVGAIVFTEHWIFPRIGLTRYWVSHKKLSISWPAVVSWAIAVVVSIILEQSGILHLFYLFVPIWLLSMLLYIIFACLAGAREKFDEPIEDDVRKPATSIPAQDDIQVRTSPDIVLWLARFVAVASLVVCFALAIWVFSSDPSSYDHHFAIFKKVLIWPTLIYFVSGTVWVVKRNKVK
jgi:NCS1 family nucleobase:cation symporter-1